MDDNWHVNGYCPVGHIANLTIDEDGLVELPEECALCAYHSVPKKVSRLSIWRETRRARKFLKRWEGGS